MLRSHRRIVPRRFLSCRFLPHKLQLSRPFLGSFFFYTIIPLFIASPNLAPTSLLSWLHFLSHLSGAFLDVNPPRSEHSYSDKPLPFSTATPFFSSDSGPRLTVRLTLILLVPLFFYQGRVLQPLSFGWRPSPFPNSPFSDLYRLLSWTPNLSCVYPPQPTDLIFPHFSKGNGPPY